MEDIFEEFGDLQEEDGDADGIILSDDDAENNVENQNDEAEEEKDKKEVKPKKIVRNPRHVLNAELLKGPKGLNALESYFDKVKFKGHHHEEEDLRVILKTYEYWCHRLYPKFPFKECISKIETLGNKGPIQTHLKKVRSGMIEPEIEANQDENLPEFNSDDDLERPVSQARPENAIDDIPIELTNEQLETIRKNREKAELLRKERLRKIKEKAAINLPENNNTTNGFENADVLKNNVTIEENISDNGSTVEVTSDDVQSNSNVVRENHSESDDDADEYVFKSVKNKSKKYFDESDESDGDQIINGENTESVSLKNGHNHNISELNGENDEEKIEEKESNNSIKNNIDTQESNFENETNVEKVPEMSSDNRLQVEEENMDFE